jgi:hydrogenase nickel incorporation protein HypB
MFQSASLVVLNKSDLAPHVDFDPKRFREAVAQVNPQVRVLQVSARSGDGLGAWYDWLTEARR